MGLGLVYESAQLLCELRMSLPGLLCGYLHRDCIKPLVISIGMSVD